VSNNPRQLKKVKFGVRQGIFLLPSILTTIAMLLGFYSMIKSMNSLNSEITFFVPAASAILIAAFFDGIDGRVARLTKTTSVFGIQYDSLADMSSFCLAPAILLYSWTLNSFGRVGWLAAFLFFACGTLRLARFNVQSQNVEKNFFQGLPTPVAGGFMAAVVNLHQQYEKAGHSAHFYMVVIAFLLSYLMVSTIRYRSFKDIDLRDRKSFSILILIILAVIIVAFKPALVISLMGIAYISMGLIEHFGSNRHFLAKTFLKKLWKPGWQPNDTDHFHQGPTIDE
jgi:CDP-diacylglycerol--serine O-phosphatidyltransferase